MTDAFVIGTSVKRTVNFVATVELFRWRAIKWLLSQCGVIAINRVKDDPRAMRTVLDSFKACFEVLERGETVAIFPEGITQDDPQLQTVKTGAARMALELEHRHGGRLGLKIVPVGLTFPAKDRYRSEALVYFGSPILVADYLKGYPEQRHTCIRELTAEIERRIQALMLHLPHLERARLVEAIKGLYLDRLWIGNRVIHEPVTPQAGELLLTQAIARVVDQAFEQHPETAAKFVRKLSHYQAALRRLHLPDEVLAQFSDSKKMLGQSLAWTILAVLAAPVAVYGWLHRFIPYSLIRMAVQKAARRENRTQVSTVSVLAGLVLFPLFYGSFVFACYLWFGPEAALWYGLSLPPASLAAHYYLRELKRFGHGLRALAVLWSAPRAARRLLTWRQELIDQIETARHRMAPAPPAQKGS